MALVACLAACSATRPQLESKPDQALTVNYRPQCAEHCEVHDLRCEPDTVPIVYGLALPVDAERAELLRDNPQAHLQVNLGCVELEFETAWVLFCRDCRSAIEGSAPPASRSIGTAASPAVRLSPTPTSPTADWPASRLARPPLAPRDLRPCELSSTTPGTGTSMA